MNDELDKSSILTQFLIDNDLNTILTTCWEMLAKGALQKKNPLQLATIGTVANQVPQLRTVVLRKTNIANRQLFFYTDIRSAKIQALKENAVISWLFYHPTKNIQIRAIGQTTIHHQDEQALVEWQKLPYYGRKTYGTVQAPSTPLPYASGDLPKIWTSPTIKLADTEYAY
ncbi:MAG: pyridoxamine 5'-phosphate oxidase family protein, partial [Saprospiraceae bacterium]